MRFRTLEIRWHDSKPISSCDFQPIPFKKARHAPGQETNYAAQSYRLATGGDDNHVRIWMVHPSIAPNTTGASADPSASSTRPPRIEYLATLSRHSAPVNVVRFSPSGELIASAGDDGMIIIWAPSSTPQTSTYGSDLTPEELQHEKEFWKPRTTFKCSTMHVYDLAWSPSGEFIIAGSTDNVARIFSAHDGKCLHELAEHSHYVQGVAWDPMNEYIATQSSDRSMHVYKISTKHGALEVHAVGKNTRMQVQHQGHHRRGSSTQGRPRVFRSESAVSDVESVVSDFKEDAPFHTGRGDKDAAPLTPATSIASTPAMFPPPPIEKTSSSRRSSFSGSNAGTASPSQMSRYGRSPSPMPALPAIRTSPWSSVKLYGDENFTNFFRRLGFSPDGGLLLTPAGQFEDPAVMPPRTSRPDESPSRGRKGRLSVNTSETSSSSSVYIYSRANFARPPIAQLPGHQKASVAVRFSPILYELREGVVGPESGKHVPAEAAIEGQGQGKDFVLDVDIFGPTHGVVAPTSSLPASEPSWSPRTPSIPLGQHLPAPVPLLPSATRGALLSTSPLLSPVDNSAHSPAVSKPPTPHLSGSQASSAAPGSTPLTGAAPTTASVFALPYRMLFAVVTKDTVAIYDTQQAGPVCLLTKLHYDEFTDMTWSPDGQCLMLSSRDGYCTIVIFDEILPAHATQQHSLQVQAIAHHHSLSLTTTTSTLTTPVVHTTPLPGTTSTSTSTSTSVLPKKRSEPPTPTPSSSGKEDGSSFEQQQQGQGLPTLPSSSSSLSGLGLTSSTSSGTVVSSTGSTAVADGAGVSEGPPKKKRRVALTKVGDLGS